jgi:hypothetical protein
VLTRGLDVGGRGGWGPTWGHLVNLVPGTRPPAAQECPVTKHWLLFRPGVVHAAHSHVASLWLWSLVEGEREEEALAQSQESEEEDRRGGKPGHRIM